MAYAAYTHDLQLGACVTRLEIDRNAAARLGVSVADIDAVLYHACGQRQGGRISD